MNTLLAKIEEGFSFRRERKTTRKKKNERVTIIYIFFSVSKRYRTQLDLDSLHEPRRQRQLSKKDRNRKKNFDLFRIRISFP